MRCERVVFSNHISRKFLDMSVPPQQEGGLVEWVRQTELIESVRKSFCWRTALESEILTETRLRRILLRPR